jgi:hypothetical protein
VGENVVTDSLAKTESIRPAVESAWEIGTGLLVTVATAAIIYGLVTVFGAWLAGPTRAAVATRRGLAPYAREPAYAYGALVLFVLLMIWWAPVPAARRLVPGLLAIALLTAGVVVLRRQIMREFPNAPRPDLRAAISRRWTQLRSGAQSHRGGGAGRAGELERLADLRERGALTDEEFASEKRAILGAGS